MSQEEKGIDSDLIRGHIDTIILKVLKTGDRYGLEIIEDVTKASSGLYELKQPTLYSCLKRLEGQGLISSYWTDSDIGGKRHYYKLTDEGSQVLQKNQDDWAKSRSIIESLIYETAPSISSVEQKEVEQKETKEQVQQIFSAQEDENVNDVVDPTELEELETTEQNEAQENEDKQSEEIEGNNENQEQYAEDELIAFNELDKEREANSPTALEIATSSSENTDNKNQDIGSQIEFSTFDKLNQSAISQSKKQDALQILFGDSDPFEKEQISLKDADSIKIDESDSEETQTEQQTQEEVFSPEAKEILPSNIPDTPTFEQQQTLKMFEANSVNASLTDNGYKDRLSQLSSIANKNFASNANKEQYHKEINYHPEDYTSISDRFKQWGISVRSHQKIERPKDEKTHIFTNKIKMARAWLTFGITTILLAISLAALIPTHPSYLTIQNALPLYITFFAVLLLYPIISSVIFSLDPNKRLPAFYAPRFSIISSLLFFIEALIIIYAINLQTGFVNFGQAGYNHLGWIVPAVASLSIIINPLVYYLLYKTKKFHC